MDCWIKEQTSNDPAVLGRSLFARDPAQENETSGRARYNPDRVTLRNSSRAFTRVV
jgi:hypothetical protein